MFTEYGRVIKGIKNTHKNVEGGWKEKCDQCYRNIDFRDLNDDSMYGIKYRVCNGCYSKGKSNIHEYVRINKEINEKYKQAKKLRGA